MENSINTIPGAPLNVINHLLSKPSCYTIWFDESDGVWVAAYSNTESVGVGDTPIDALIELLKSTIN